MSDGILIDGSMGEGGGQVLRTALTLSVLTGKPARLIRIRGKRTQPGLRAEHLAAIRAAAGISGARVGGAEPGSLDLLFVPDRVRPVEIREEVGTAGATSLVLQTVALPLALAHGPSRVRLRGGTHVPRSPTFDMLESDWIPAMTEMGIPLNVRLNRTGYAPSGGGEILALIPGACRPRPLHRKVRGNLRSVRGTAWVTKLGTHHAERMGRESRRQLRRAGVAARVDVETRSGSSPASGIHLTALMEGEERIGFSALGDKGLSSERVARAATNAFFDWLDSGAGTPPHLADQILVPLAIADGPSVYTTSRVTKHLLTTVVAIRQFLPARIEVEGREGEPGEVRVVPAEPVPR